MFDTSSRVTAFRRAGFGPALLTSVALTFVALTFVALTFVALITAPAHAQTELDLGQSNPLSGGTATITSLGTTADGTYQYLDADGNPVVLDPTLTDYGYVVASGTSAATVSGGTIGGIVTYDTSTVTLNGGTLNTLVTYDTSVATVSGGSLNSLGTFGSSIATVSGGSLLDLSTFGSSVTNVSGGGSFTHLETYDSSTLNLFGTGFTETLLSTNVGIYPYLFYSITGTLQNGDLLSVDYTDYGGNLVLNAPAAVPEASSVVSLGLLLMLGLGGFAASRCRKTQTVA